MGGDGGAEDHREGREREPPQARFIGRHGVKRSRPVRVLVEGLLRCGRRERPSSAERRPRFERSWWRSWVHGRRVEGRKGGCGVAIRDGGTLGAFSVESRRGRRGSGPIVVLLRLFPQALERLALVLEPDLCTSHRSVSARGDCGGRGRDIPALSWEASRVATTARPAPPWWETPSAHSRVSIWQQPGRRATHLGEHGLQDSRLVGRDCDPPPLGLGLLLRSGLPERTLVLHPGEATPRRELVLEILECRLILPFLAWLLLQPAHWYRRREYPSHMGEDVVVLTSRVCHSAEAGRMEGGEGGHSEILKRPAPLVPRREPRNDGNDSGQLARHSTVRPRPLRPITTFDDHETNDLRPFTNRQRRRHCE